MFADYLNFTVPDHRDHEVTRLLVDRLSLLGCSADTPDLYRLNSGTFKITRRKGFIAYGCSGGLLAALRGNSSLSPFLHTIGSGEHRVTRLDVALDVSRDSPAVLKRLRHRAKSSGVRLTRKRISPKNVCFIERHNYSDPSAPTGTLYLGASTAEVRCKVYDKRNERLDKGFADVGPLLRYELTVTGKLNPSLRDVVEPQRMFWHYMGDVIPNSANHEPWEGLGDSYRLEPPGELEPFELMRRRLESSADVRDLLELADRIGPNGLRVLTRMLADSHRPSSLSNKTDSGEAA